MGKMRGGTWTSEGEIELRSSEFDPFLRRSLFSGLGEISSGCHSGAPHTGDLARLVGLQSHHEIVTCLPRGTYIALDAVSMC